MRELLVQLIAVSRATFEEHFPVILMEYLTRAGPGGRSIPGMSRAGHFSQSPEIERE
jgi:hypothetical protein